MVHLGDLVHDVATNFRAFIFFIVLSLVGAFVYLTNTPPQYGVSVQLIAVPEWLRSQSGSTSAVGGLSSLLGSTRGGEDMFLLFSRALAIPDIYRDLDVKMDARRHYYSALWDRDRDSWMLPGGLAGLRMETTNALKRMVNYPQWAGPTQDDLRDLLLKKMEISNNTDGSMLVEMKSNDPDYDRRALQFIIDRADAVVRAQLVNYLNYTASAIRQQIDRETDVSLRNALIDKLSQALARKAELENNKIMALNLNKVEVSDRPLYPSFSGVLLVAILIGIMLPFGYILLRRLLE
jgi:hypothetical protein